MDFYQRQNCFDQWAEKLENIDQTNLVKVQACITKNIDKLIAIESLTVQFNKPHNMLQTFVTAFLVNYCFHQLK